MKMSYNQSNTIAAISTAQGIGGIGVIRVSGIYAIAIVEKIFSSISQKNLSSAKGYTAHYGHILDELGEIVDEVVVTVFRAPRSYTGEDVVEISCHGGLYVTKSVLRLVLAKGAEIAEPGEFTKRAFLNGKISLTQAEAVMDIIGAKNKQAAEAAMYAHEGALNKKISAIKESLIQLDAKLSVWVDYPDDDIADIDDDSLKNNLYSIKQRLEKLLHTYSAGKIMREGVYTVIVGEPNVGKSTLMNLLSCCERSIVTDIPGTTRDVVEETVNLGEITLRLADTAGIHDTEDQVERIGVNLAKSHINKADLILLVLDSSKILTEKTLQLIDLVKDKNVIAILNKTDLDMNINVVDVKRYITHVIKMSATLSNGLDDLSKKIYEISTTSQLDPSEGILSTERQANAIKKTLDFVNEALHDLKSGVTLDAVTVIIENAIEQLLDVTGENVSDLVIENVFKNFCVGK